MKIVDRFNYEKKWYSSNTAHLTIDQVYWLKLGLVVVVREVDRKFFLATKWVRE